MQGSFKRTGWRCSLWACAFAGLGADAQAVEIGKLHWRTPPGQPPYAEIALSDKEPVDASTIRGRLAARGSYDVAGLIYDPRLADMQIRVQQAPDGQVSLRLDRLPADAAGLDLLITVADRAGLSLAEYHLDPRRGPVELPPSPAGTRLASKSGAATAPHTARSPAPTSAAFPSAKTAPLAAAAEGPALAAARAALHAWAAAWSRRDVDAYVAAYVPDYAGRGDLPSRQAWLAQRRERILARQRISVEIDKLRLTRQGLLLTADFEQRYRSDALDQRVRKQMVLASVDGRWLIRSETERR